MAFKLIPHYLKLPLFQPGGISDNSQ